MDLVEAIDQNQFEGQLKKSHDPITESQMFLSGLNDYFNFS